MQNLKAQFKVEQVVNKSNVILTYSLAREIIIIMKEFGRKMNIAFLLPPLGPIILTRRVIWSAPESCFSKAYVLKNNLEVSVFVRTTDSISQSVMTAEYSTWL